MSHPIFEMLENAGFISESSVNTDAVARARRSRIVDMALDSVDLTSTSQIERSGTIFSHTASLALSGHPSPCTGLGCRLKAVNDLAQFAAFYSDKVYINNGLASVANGHGHRELSELRQRFNDELELLLTLRPLIDLGIIVPVTPTEELICFHCLGKSVLKSSDSAKFDRSLRSVTNRFLKEVNIDIECDEWGDLYLHIRGDDELVEHGFLNLAFGNIKKLKKSNPRLASTLIKHGIAPLSKSMRKHSKIDHILAHDIFNDIGFEMAMSQSLGSSVVTSHSIDVEIMKDFVETHELNRRNSIIERHLTCMVPYLNSVTTSELIDLRNAENDAFISFRHTFAKAIDNHIKGTSGRFTEKDAEAIYRDIIQPELARMNRKAKAAGGSIFRKSRANVLGWAAAITTGVYFGFVESSIAAAAQALGLTKVAAELASGLMSTSKEDSVRDENFFFLWKACQHN
jgi:hypothetical protein